MDFCPAFWEWLIARNVLGRVYSIDRIGTELEKFEDSLCAWTKDRGTDFFLPFDQVAADRLAEVAAWPGTQARFTDAAKAAFHRSADMYLIAYALAHGCTLVTQEVSRPESRSTVKIPDVCEGLNVKYISLWELLRAEGAVFVLKT